jgi:leucyl-tRNA synthetase
MDDEIEIVLQVNGKVREKMMIGADWDNESIKAKALENEKIKEYISGTEIVKVIVVPKKLVNIVIKRG